MDANLRETGLHAVAARGERQIRAAKVSRPKSPSQSVYDRNAMAKSTELAIPSVLDDVDTQLVATHRQI